MSVRGVDLTFKQYLRMEMMPHIWCPGCGNGIIMRAFLQAVHELKLDPNKVVAVSGIGCSGRTPGYLDFCTLHTTHGRPIAFATGIKLARPELTVVVFTGDGDCLAIGGNHFIHAARRNIDITVILFNNGVYAMTNGQVAPLTPKGAFTTTSPYGNPERPFDTVQLAIGAGATYVARGTTYHARELARLIKEAIAHKGFSVVEVLTQCPTYFGRLNKLGDGAKMLQWLKEIAVPKSKAEKMSPEELEGKFVIGELYRKEGVPEGTEVYWELVRKAREKAKA